MDALCYLCGKPATTGDHAPPAGFFPDPKPDNLITVPCCRKCNGSYSMDDEAFRAWIVAPENLSAAGHWIRENKVYQNTFKNRPKLVENIKLHMGEIEIDGKKVDVLNFPADRANRFLIRLTKALLAKFYPNYPRNDQEYEVVPVDPTGHNLKILERVRDAAIYDQRGDGVFQFRHAVYPVQEWGCWLFTFYEASLFLVRHRSNAKAQREGVLKISP